MKNISGELAKTQPMRPTLLCLLIVAQISLSSKANDFRLGPLIDLSDPDAFAACGSNGAEKETSVAANPANPKNLVSTWIGGSFKGIGGAVSVDGGRRWQQVLIPGLSICNGGTTDFTGNADPWLSFAPNGDLYHLCLAGNGAGRNAVLVSKSSDGGLHWAAPTILWDTTDKRLSPDYTRITADPTDSRYVYATWDIDDSGNRGKGVLARTTDGGRTWEPGRVFYDPGSANGATLGHTINVLPGGMLVDIFAEFKYSDDGTHKGALLSAIRSTDKGQTWSQPIRAAAIPVFSVLDPETGVAVVNSSSCCPNPANTTDPNNGNLYVVWEETSFGNGQYSSIAFAMSADGGLTWSAPIQVNKTPTNIPVANRQAFIPAIAVAADGTIGVSYYDFRFNDASAGMPTDYWLVHCHPSAITPATDPASWGNEVRLTATSFDIERAPAPSGAYFIGDYEGLATVGNDFLATWSQPHDTDLDSIFFRRLGP
jgi:hypothetical protein